MSSKKCFKEVYCTVSMCDGSMLSVPALGCDEDILSACITLQHIGPRQHLSGKSFSLQYGSFESQPNDSFLVK